MISQVSIWETNQCSIVIAPLDLDLAKPRCSKNLDMNKIKPGDILKLWSALSMVGKRISR